MIAILEGGLRSLRRKERGERAEVVAAILERGSAKIGRAHV